MAAAAPSLPLTSPIPPVTPLDPLPPVFLAPPELPVTVPVAASVHPVPPLPTLPVFPFELLVAVVVAFDFPHPPLVFELAVTVSEPFFLLEAQPLPAAVLL